ncbi:glutamine--fructose-6-phosphate transaminase (isomerizing) [Umboniibacter marinipuniceus]|uniref:Glutamine--fructose-6-phosphate aminotransferase [isomerizing] n=1 Tax=Umboniibacter marinipuniceus TaxID=569599 RepID=A0A3M0A3I3_9GAMM|nr:glutamine--fructose-6-phosphate transaminase (isomerizing) [Umboniibacter marinipuniceus]RMA79543.1 glutamine--fructose-6-phosphate transaminase [Umboniibacter marinipuniceus]
MCGIVGAIANHDVTASLVDGLRKLEYRGYDSAGVALLNGGKLERRRAVGKVQNLANVIEATPVQGVVGIAHTRWATHGQPTEANAHPHVSSNIAVVHNGIIENYATLRDELKGNGYVFTSDTDTEVIAHLVHSLLAAENISLLRAVQRASRILHGAYGMVIIDQKHPDQLVVARSGSPLVIGHGEGENYVASDPLALAEHTSQFTYLEEGDVAKVTTTKIDIYNDRGEHVLRDQARDTEFNAAVSKGEYRHFMLKEIYEQPSVVQRILEGRIGANGLLPEAFDAKTVELFKTIENITIIACGTSYHAGLVARYWIEELAGIPCNVEIASEFRYRKIAPPKNAMLLTISQSGETADTLAGLRVALDRGFVSSLTICNVPGSSLVRESDAAFMTRAGTEVGVASTKAFTAQLVSLLLVTLQLAKTRGYSQAQEVELCNDLHKLPAILSDALSMAAGIEHLSAEFIHKQHALFLGRGVQYPVAMEGALKLKEISYIHAEAYAAGELKHGPLALIDEDMPVIAVAPNDELLDKLKSNLEEVRARGGELFVFKDKNADFTDGEGITLMDVPHVSDVMSPLVYNIPLQLLSYYVALIKGTDVDQPRNLAKSVTVE